MSASGTIPDYRLYRERADEGGDFWLHSEPLADRTRLHRYEIAPHRHPALFQLFAVTEGSGEIFDGQEWLRFNAPCGLFVPPATTHGFRFSRDVSGTVITALANRLHPLTAADVHLAAFASSIRIVSGAGLQEVAAIDSERSEAPPGRAAALEARVALAIVGLARSWAKEAGGPPRLRGDQRVEALHGLLATHAAEGRPLSFYADRLGLSGAQLNRLARKASGATVQALASRVLVDAACRDLVFTSTPVSRIADTLGFSDPAYFNRFFKRHTGATPGRFREAERRRLAGAGTPPAGDTKPTFRPS